MGVYLCMYIYIYWYIWLWCLGWRIMLIQHLSWLRLIQEAKDAEITYLVFPAEGMQQFLNISGHVEIGFGDAMKLLEAVCFTAFRLGWALFLSDLYIFVPFATQSEVGHGMKMDGSSNCAAVRMETSADRNWPFCTQNISPRIAPSRISWCLARFSLCGSSQQSCAAAESPVTKLVFVLQERGMTRTARTGLGGCWAIHSLLSPGEIEESICLVGPNRSVKGAVTSVSCRSMGLEPNGLLLEVVVFEHWPSIHICNELYIVCYYIYIYIQL